MLKRTSAFMQRNSSWVTFSMLNLWESSFILTQCSYILDTCIRWLCGERKKNSVKGEEGADVRRVGAERNIERRKTINGGISGKKRKKQQR